MDTLSTFSRRSFLTITLFMALLLLLVDLSFYYGLDVVFSKITISGKTGGSIEISGIIDNLISLQKILYVYFVPMSAFVFALAGFLLWLLVRSSLSRALKQNGKGVDDRLTARSGAAAAVDLKQKEEEDNRLFLHLLTVFQRDGRFVDFISEDLTRYEDVQIGAAVRDIHDGCKTAMKKYVSLKPVIDSGEGEDVVIEEGFNPSAVKLTGNVTGQPPFKGVLRHRGWQVAKLERPKLSGGEASQVIAPAEVEIG